MDRAGGGDGGGLGGSAGSKSSVKGLLLQVQNLVNEFVKTLDKHTGKQQALTAECKCLGILITAATTRLLLDPTDDDP